MTCQYSHTHSRKNSWINIVSFWNKEKANSARERNPNTKLSLVSEYLAVDVKPFVKYKRKESIVTDIILKSLTKTLVLYMIKNLLKLFTHH